MKNILAFVFVVLFSTLYITEGYAQVPGTFDPTFGTNGEMADSAINGFKYSSMALSPGNQFVVSSAIGHTIQVIRFTYIGVRDIDFGQNSGGLVQISDAGFSGSVSTSLVQPDRKILIGGQYTLNTTGNKGYLLRLNANGTADSSFGTNGWLFFNFLPHFGENVRQISLQTDGKIVALDMGINPGYTDTVVVVRINTNGTLDNTYAVNGYYQVPFNSFLATSPIFFNLDANNNFTFAGYSNYQAGDYLYLFRLTAAGVLDTTYGSAGSILIDSTNIINGGANMGLCFQNDGKLLTVQSKITGDLLWAVCRYNTDGSIDQSFGSNGLVNVQPNLDPLPYDVHSIAVTSTDQIIIAGVVSEAGSNRDIVCSFNTDGSPNLSFGNNTGSQLLNSFRWDDIVYNLLIEPNDEILLNGLINETNGSYEVVKLLAPSPSTGIQAVQNNTDFSLYPDPATDLVSFKLSTPLPGYITVTDITGNQVLVQQVTNSAVQTICVNNLASGLYMVTYKNDAGVVSKKIVKQ